MAFFPGQYNMAGGSWVDPSRVQTSQSGGAYIGGMAPQLPTQDMSFMWGGNGGAATAGTSPSEWWNQPVQTGGVAGSGWGSNLGPNDMPLGPRAPNPNPLKNDPNFTPTGGGAGPLIGANGQQMQITGGTQIGPMVGTGATYAPAGTPDYTQQVNALYAGVGKTPDLIDQEGRDYWTSQLAAGNDVSSSFKQAAAGTYANMLNGQASPYAAQNAAGFQNLNSTNSGGSTPGSTGYGGGSNPYMGGMADDIQRRTQEMLGQSFAGINSQAVGTGGLGGTRQGVAQGIAGGRAADYMSGQLANMYGNQYNMDANRSLSRYQGDQSNALGNKNADYGFFTANRGLDQGDFRNGLAAYGLANEGDWSGLNNANGIYGNYTGFGNTTTSGQSGGGWQGGIGGAISGAALGRQMGWW